jgi:hypothetical protein
MRDVDVPVLTLPMVKLGPRETPWDLRCLMFRGGAAVKANQLATLIAEGRLGSPMLERRELVQRIHAELAGALVAGRSKETVRNAIYCLRTYFAWVDDAALVVSLDTVVTTYIRWTDHILHRQRIVQDLRERGAYQLAKSVANVLDNVLDRRTSVLADTRIRRPRSDRQTHGSTAAKQNLEQSFIFGHALIDICNALTVDTIRGPLPVRIPLRNGKVLEEWSFLPRVDAEGAVVDDSPQRRRPPISEQARASWAADTSLRTRYPLVNLRIEVELLLFIAQTGLNLTQAHTARTGHFHYTSHLDGYQVRRYKHRRQGEVEFEIYREYRNVLEGYLTWRSVMFPGEPDGLMFPFVRRSRAEDAPPRFTRVRSICGKLGIDFIPPQALRKIRINWLLRELNAAPLVAEMAQHAQETLLRDYAEPNPQIAMVEIARFLREADPSVVPPGPGRCALPAPVALPNIPLQATQPDCISPAGCLFCVHQRDIDSEDHVWSLTSFRYLKSLELARDRPSSTGMTSPALHPAALAIDRLIAKLKFYEGSSEVRRLWVREALLRTEEGDYHPAWRGFIRLAELRS